MLAKIWKKKKKKKKTFPNEILSEMRLKVCEHE